MSYLLALDEGTTSARAALYDQEGKRLAMAAVPLQTHHPFPGWVEQDAVSIWRAQAEAMRNVLEQKGLALDRMAAIGITNQRETTVVWDRQTGTPVAPAIVWQCRRTADWCAELSRSSSAATIERETGLVIDAYFSGSKIRWILEHVPDAQRKARDGELLFGTVDSWLIWQLTRGKTHVTDVTNASRTMLMDLDTGTWSESLLKLFDIPSAMLPDIVPSSGVVGTTDTSQFHAAVSIAGIAGDQQSALFGQACFRPGLAKNTYGTGCFALLHTGDQPVRSRHRLLGTRAAGTSQFALEGSVFVAGAAVQWLRDQLGIIQTAAQTRGLAESVADTGGVYLVPAFTGLGAPHWDGQARGLLTGLTLGTGRAEIARATLESIAYQTKELIDAMQADSGQPLSELRVDGGAAANDFLMQFQADLLQCPLVRPADTETTALGAAYLAGLAVGVFKDTGALESFWAAERVFYPQMDDTRRDQLWSGWQEAVSRTLSRR